MEEFATGWDDLPQYIPGRTEYRVLIKTGRVVPMVSVIAIDLGAEARHRERG